jgi:3-oxoacyl-(acyl-carrier-protein) synthase
VTPAGIGREAFWKGILEPVSRVSVVKRFPDDAGAFVAAEIKRFSVEDYVNNGGAKRMARHTQFALAAAKLALADAGIPVQDVRGLSPVVVTGTSLMDSDVINRTIENVERKGARFGLSRVVYQGPVSAVASAVAEKIGGARTLTLQSACCAGSDAIGHAAALVAEGACDLAICGGTEAPIYYHPMLELKMAGLSPDTAERPEQLSRPFDMWRTTGVIGEGACLLILEPESSPRRGYAYVSGYAFATDTANAPGAGWLESVRLCMANGNARASEVDLISAWGPGHRSIDALEARVLRNFFGDLVDEIPTVSIKGAIGNPFAAAGAIQVGCAALGMRESTVPPTVNWQHVDPACRLNLSAHARFLPSSAALISSHGLSGTNSCLLLRKCT